MMHTLRDVPSLDCKIRSCKIVEFETYGDRVLAVVLGQVKVNEKEHPYLVVTIYVTIYI